MGQSVNRLFSDMLAESATAIFVMEDDKLFLLTVD